jgi:M6 family metalloprotease-like protein
MKKIIPLAMLFASALHAQDIEVTAQQRGRTLPKAYYDRIRENPDAFELKAGWKARLATAQLTGNALTGTLPIAIIPALFSDSDAPEPIITTAALQSKLFSPTSGTTVNAYYVETSHGKLHINGLVTDWAHTSLTRAEVVGNSFGIGDDGRVRDWILEAIANVDDKVDFSQFDNDGPDGIPNSGDDDGRVDMAAFLFREIDAACGGNAIWPHRSYLEAGPKLLPAVTNDLRPNGSPIVIDDYIALGAHDCSGQHPLEVNVFAHETGHVLGLPDYYDSSSGLLRQQRRWVVGCWDIMSAGSWGCGSGVQPSTILPPHFGAYTKMLFGWNNPQAVEQLSFAPHEFTLRPAYSTGDALRIKLSFNEYLFVEYRQRQGFDAGLPASGILVYHVETGRGFLPCPTCPHTYSYATVEADGDSALVRQEPQGGNRGAAGDAWGISKTLLDDTTIPSTRLNTGLPSWIKLSKMTIDAAQGVARVTVSFSTSRIPIERLVAALGMTPLTNEDVLLLDTSGNSNNKFDVGDFRAYLQIRAAG